MNKPRLIVVTGKDLKDLLERRAALDTPVLTVSMGVYWVDPIELRAWRASQATSEADK